MLEDILREAPLYKSLIAQGKEEGLRKAVLALFEKRFSHLSSKAQEISLTINNPDVLQNLLLNIAVAQNEKEAEQYLLEVARQRN